MIQIRPFVFETNSSADHSIVSTEDDYHNIVDDTFEGELNLFKLAASKHLWYGIGPYLLRTWIDKLSYVMASYVNPIYANTNDDMLVAGRRFKEVEKLVKTHVPGVTKIIPGFYDGCYFGDPDIKECTASAYFGHVDEDEEQLVVDYLENEMYTLEEIIFSPNIIIKVIDDWYEEGDELKTSREEQN